MSHAKIITELMDKPSADEPTVIRTDAIQCPQCGQVQEADVVWAEGHPWPTFIHECAECKYMIMESEWDSLSVATWQNQQLLATGDERSDT